MQVSARGCVDGGLQREAAAVLHHITEISDATSGGGKKGKGKV